MSTLLIPATPGRHGSVLDIQQLLWEYPGKLRLIPLGKNTFLAKASLGTQVDLESVRTRLSVLAQRTDGQRMMEYAQAKEDFLKFVEVLLEKDKPRRVAQQLAYLNLTEAEEMGSDEKEYWNFLMTELQTAGGERKLHLQREIDRLNREGWDQRSACEKCGNPIPVEKLKRHLRTGICYTCQQ